MAIVYWHGKRFDTITRDALVEVERLFGKRLRVTQGSYSYGSLSAGTHGGPGAVDLAVDGLSTSEIHRLTKIMRQCGFAAWYRTYADRFSPHIHGIRCGTYGLPRGAASQVEAFKRGRNGLSNNAPDRQAWLNVKPTTWQGYNAWRKIPLSGATALRRGVKVVNLEYKKSNSDVKAAQIALRKFLIARGYDPNRYNPSDATGYYGDETVKLIEACTNLLARETGNSAWTSYANKRITALLAKKLNLPVVA